MPRKSTSQLFQTEEKEELKQGDMNLPETEPATESVEKKEQSEEVEKETKSILQNVKDSGNLLPQPSASAKDDIVDIDFSAIQKKRFRINGDNSKILELNTSDMGIATRLKEAYPRLNNMVDEVASKLSDIPDDDDEKILKAVGEAVDELDKKMRQEVDYIFNSNVSEICGSDGSMWDPIDGVFRYEHIIDKLVKLYENNLDKEFADMKRRVETTAGKYVKLQDHKKKAK